MARSRTQKGSAFQRWCRDWLVWQGYDVHNQTVAARAIPDKVTKQLKWVSYRNDIFGCDLIAIKAGEKPRFIQCTEHKGIQKRYTVFAGFGWPLEHCQVELWSKVGRGHDMRVVIRVFNGNELQRWGEIKKRRLYLYGRV